MNTEMRHWGVFLETFMMIYVYRFGLGSWALLCVLSVIGVTLAVQRYSYGFAPNALPVASFGTPQHQSANAFPCKSMVYGISRDGVQYVRETGGGTVFAAQLNQQVRFYHLNPYGYMVPVDRAALDTETAGRLSTALLQCVGPWLPAGTWFTLSAMAEPISDLNAASENKAPVPRLSPGFPVHP